MTYNVNEHISKVWAIQYRKNGKPYAFHAGGEKYNPALRPVEIKLYQSKAAAGSVLKRSGLLDEHDCRIVDGCIGVPGIKYLYGVIK